MSNTIVKVDNLFNKSIYFFQSKFVKIYPAGFRGTYGSGDEIYYFDPESNIPTEFNLTKALHKLPNKPSYIIGLNDNNELEVVLDGYYFKISNFINQMDQTLVDTKLSLIWSLESIDYELPTAQWDSQRSTSILRNLYKYLPGAAMGYNLDLNSDLSQGSGSYIFTGIALIKTSDVIGLNQSDIHSLTLGTYKSDETFTFASESYSIFQTIQHGKGDYSLKYNDDSNSADGNYSFAGGKNTEVSNNYGFGFGDHVTAKNNTHIAFGEYNKNEDYFEIGRGTNISKRNIFSVTENGNVKFTGSLSFLESSAYIDDTSFRYKDLVSGINTGNGWNVVLSTKSFDVQSDNTSLINTYGLYLSAPTITANGDVSVTRGLSINNKITGKGALEINGEASFGTAAQYVKLQRGNVTATEKVSAKEASFSETATARTLKAIHRIEVLDEKDLEGNIIKEHAGLHACQAKIDRNLAVNGFAEINGVASSAVTLERVKTVWKPSGTGTLISGTKSSPSVWRPDSKVEVTEVMKRKCYSEDCGLVVKRKILNGNGIVTLGDIDAQYGDVKSSTSTILDKLTVADKTIISSSGITANDITCDSFYSKSINTPSDIRLKENIVEYKNTNSILDLDVKQFNYINNPKTQIGFIAQDVQKLFPELVETDSNGFLGIKETKLVYLLLDEVKKLRKEIEELKK